MSAIESGRRSPCLERQQHHRKQTRMAVAAASLGAGGQARLAHSLSTPPLPDELRVGATNRARSARDPADRTGDREETFQVWR